MVEDHGDEGDDDHESYFAYPRSLDYLNGKILVGQREGKILEIDVSSGEKKLLLASHHEGEAWGLEVIPEDNTILTVGDDNKIFAFDYLNRKLKGEAEIHAEGKHLKKPKVVASSLSEYHGTD